MAKEIPVPKCFIRNPYNPPFDLLENDQFYLVKVEIAGVKKEGVSAYVYGENLCITIHKKESFKQQPEGLYPSLEDLEPTPIHPELVEELSPVKNHQVPVSPQQSPSPINDESSHLLSEGDEESEIFNEEDAILETSTTETSTIIDQLLISSANSSDTTSTEESSVITEPSNSPSLESNEPTLITSSTTSTTTTNINNNIDHSNSLELSSSSSSNNNQVQVSTEMPLHLVSSPSTFKYIIKESVSSGLFSRNVIIPQNVDPSKISASFKDGLLILTLPKSNDKQSPIKININ
ncbi:hypothetical protein DFA_11185 [Cavenderia fasciculata]|uniref:SHSP domain-containing protein n=1 Tax=Cavenderia fasciculata TaxID=261658 RepID=F4QFB7_CACFS|nr:uncharacterized protein DFA_11185 [Cavenderia fasciculata]EGG13424.1 hypothetical protein DFA_11185 [Cavenderia fasciculata]|eukprot:XP_004350128.1 hypothetical protein DFA_11185 [Cavenderia fasciculata]